LRDLPAGESEAGGGLHSRGTCTAHQNDENWSVHDGLWLPCTGALLYADSEFFSLYIPLFNKCETSHFLAMRLVEGWRKNAFFFK
jgi:hypothetical protein